MMANFSEALNMIKGNQRVRRAGWNGKGMWLMLVEFDGYMVDSLLPDGTPLLSWIGMFTADKSFVPWFASQTDLLAEDWELAT